MAVYRRKGSKNWWYRFVWRGETIRESTKQGNRRTAEAMEAAHKTRLAKAEVGIREPKPVPTLTAFLEGAFLPFCETTHASKPKTLEHYRFGAKALLGFERLAHAKLDEITGQDIATLAESLRAREFKVSSVNRVLQVLRRAFALAAEWAVTEKALAKVRMLSGENHRERILSESEQDAYLAAAGSIGDSMLLAYEKALTGIRATKRGETPIKPEDPYRLRDVIALLLDTAIRPEEAFRLRWEQLRDGAVWILSGKTANARRRIPLSPQAASFLEMRRGATAEGWVFPAPTRSGHIESTTLKRRHAAACKLSSVAHFELYTCRHSCLTRWAASGMDPWTLAYLAGHSDMNITRRYVHPTASTIAAALDRARGTSEAPGGHNSGHSPENQHKDATDGSGVIN
jgi:integrase